MHNFFRCLAKNLSDLWICSIMELTTLHLLCINAQHYKDGWLIHYSQGCNKGPTPKSIPQVLPSTWQ